MLGNISEGYKRLRHTRGHGVHSPFAYMLVKEAVHPSPQYAYYGDLDIDNSFGNDFVVSMRRHARILLRLIVLLQPKTVYMPQGIHPAFPTAVKCADSSIILKRGLGDAPNCDMICSTDSKVPLDTLLEFISRPGSIIAIRKIPEDWVDRIFEALPEGLVLRGKKTIIAVNRPRMQKIQYKLYF